MPVTLYEIKVISNAARTFEKDAAAAEASSAAINKNTASTKVNEKAKQSNSKSTGALSRAIARLTRALTLDNKTKKRNIILTKLMNRANRTAGLNIGMLSFRISEGLVPVLGIMYTAMLPVIAGLLAIASAAAVATGGVIGLMGVGLYAWSKRFKKNASGYTGARRPYDTSQDVNFSEEVMKGFTEVLADPALQGRINRAIEWTKKIFHDVLPNALKEFILNVDMGAIERIMEIFSEWLPNAARGLAKWGNQMFNLIGERSLSAINKLFSYIANGLKSTAEWLKSSGFDQLDDLMSTLGSFIGLFTKLGKSVLPIIIEALKSIYPTPFKPVVNLLVKLFNSMSQSKTIMTVIGILAKIIASLILLSSFSAVLGSVISGFFSLMSVLSMIAPVLIQLATVILGSTVGIIALIGVLAYLIWKYREQIKEFFVKLGTWIIDGLKSFFSKISDIFNLEFGSEEAQEQYGHVFDSVSTTPMRQEVKVTVDENQFGIGVTKVVEDDLSRTIAEPT